MVAKLKRNQFQTLLAFLDQHKEPYIFAFSDSFWHLFSEFIDLLVDF